MNLFTESIKKRLCRYALQRYLGNYILEKISLDQLSLELSSSSGAAEITNVELDVKGLNELSETQHWPIQFIDGYIESVRVELPWSNILSDNSRIRVTGLMLTVQPTSWAEEASLFESMYSSMMSSKQMAEEIFRTSEPALETETLTGLDQCAAAIETIFNRVIVSFTDTIFRVEQIMHEGENHFWTALEVKVGSLEYHDAHASSDNKTMLEELASRSTKKVILSDVEFLVDKFNDAKRTEQSLHKTCGPLCATNPEIKSSPVTVAFFKGPQEVEICVNRNDRGDHSSTPKIGVKVTLSEVPIYIEPRQILHLTALLNSFAGATGSDSGVHHESPCTAFGPKDFAVIEHELQTELNGPCRLSSFDSVPSLTNIGALGNTQHMWAGRSGDEYDEQYLPMNSNDSPTTSQMTSDILCGNKKTIQSEFSLHIGTVYMVILEKQNINEERDEANEANTLSKNNNGYAKFFKEIDGVPLRDIITVTTSEFLPDKHFRLVLHPVQLKGRTYSSLSQRFVEFKLTISNADLVRGKKNWVESIVEGHLKADNGTKEQGGGPLPFLRLMVNHRYSNSVASGKTPVSDVKCDFGVVHLKYDRLLELQLLEMFETPAATSGNKKFEDHSAKPHAFNIEINCPRLSSDLRFQALEVANIRKELRPDALTITLEKIYIQGNFSNDLLCNELKILFQCGFADYRPDASKINEVIQLARVFSDPDDIGCGAASIIIKVSSTERNLLQENPLMDSMCSMPVRGTGSIDMTKSMYGKFNESGPFKTRNVAPSETSGEEAILAGESKLIQAFYEQCQMNSKVVVDISLPTVIVEFANRELLEIIYNRVLIDLAYTPSCEAYFAPPEAADLNTEKNPFLERNSFERSYAGEQFFYSVAPESCVEDHRLRLLEQNLLSLSLTVNNACVLVGHGCAEKSEYFSFQIKPQQIQLYVVNGYQGDANEGFVMLHATDVEVYHEAHNEKPTETHEELSKDMMLPKKGTRRLLQRIHKDTFGKLRRSSANNQPKKEMLCFVLRIRAEPTARMKKMTMAVSVEETAWSHEMTPSRQLWILQLMELATLRDMPIAGHVPSSIVTELHFNLERSIIDYRPNYIPYSLILSIENFSLSTNVVPKSSASTLRLIFENTSLLVACNIDKRKTADILEDYVCVIYADLLDLRIVLTGSSHQTQSSPECSFSPGSTAYLKSCPAPETDTVIAPALQFTASNNELQIRTCADSLRALQAIAMYVSNDGDLVATRERTPSEPHRSSSVSLASNSPPQQGFEQLQNDVPLSQACPTAAPPSYDDIVENMEDAMSDSDDRSHSDERLSQFSSSSRSPSFDHGTDSSPADKTVFYSASQDNEFLILEDLPGSGHLRDKTQESIRVINGDEIVLIDNYLKAPSEKTDQLKAPKGYPDPVESYTFQQQKLVWFIYGGTDFGESRTVMDRITDLKTLGGQGRMTNNYMELALTKIRFRHELYAPGETKASRQCLYIKDVEIIDKLPTSEANKFLYQYSSDSLPRQANANVLTFKRSQMAPENECSIYISVKPLRLNVDQDALIFLTDFFTAVTGSMTVAAPNLPRTRLASPAGQPLEVPAMFIQSFVFSPDVPIIIDYRGRHVNLDNGAVSGLIMGLASFSCMELTLKNMKKRNVKGYDRLRKYVVDEWYNDITKRQLHNVAYSVGPMHSIVKLVSGVRDLVVLPVESYRKDGQIVRGFQKGTKSFGTNAALAFLDLTERAVSTIQQAAELAYNLLSPTAGQTIMPPVSHQPLDFREGVHNAYIVMANGIKDTTRTLAAAAATDTRNSKGVTGAVGEVLRQIPPAMVRPIIDATVATNNVLNGVKYQLVPEARQEDLDKWKKPHNGKMN